MLKKPCKLDLEVSSWIVTEFLVCLFKLANDKTCYWVYFVIIRINGFILLLVLLSKCVFMFKFGCFFSLSDAIRHISLVILFFFLGLVPLPWSIH